ncbi:MAG: hypothetical protein WKG07_34035 [Hymenobacter sp.]
MMSTSGRRWRMTHTMSASTCSLSQMVKVSADVLEKPKSLARVKNCRPPSMRRAASSSWVRMTPRPLAQLGADEVLAAVAAGAAQVAGFEQAARWRGRR